MGWNAYALLNLPAETKLTNLLDVIREKNSFDALRQALDHLPIKRDDHAGSSLDFKGCSTRWSASETA